MDERQKQAAEAIVNAMYMVEANFNTHGVTSTEFYSAVLGHSLGALIHLLDHDQLLDCIARMTSLVHEITNRRVN